MLHLLKYQFLPTIRSRSIMFWALTFPLILGTLFYVSFGNTGLAELRLSLTGQDLNLLPNGVLVLEGEDVSHLRAGIAIDHSGSFLVIGTLVVTQPLYRARVQVWVAGINLTFCRKSGHEDVRVFASQIRTGFRRLPAPSPARYKRFAFI